MHLWAAELELELEQRSPTDVGTQGPPVDVGLLLQLVRAFWPGGNVSTSLAQGRRGAHLARPAAGVPGGAVVPLPALFLSLCPTPTTAPPPTNGTRPARIHSSALHLGVPSRLDAANPLGWEWPPESTAPRRSQTRQPRRRPPGSSGSCGPPVVFQSVPAPPGAAAATTHLVRVGKFEVVKVHLADLLGEERPGMPRPHVHLPAEGDVRPRPSSGGPPRRGERTGRSPAAPRTPGGYRRRASCRGAPLPCTRAPGRAPRGTACTPCGG